MTDRRCLICGEALHTGKTYCSLKCYHKSSQFKEMLARRNPIKLKNNTSFKKGHIPWNKGKTNVYSETRLKELRIQAQKRTGSKNPFYGRTHTEETKEIISKKAIDRFKDLNYKEKIVKKSMIARERKPNKLELQFNGLLENSFPNEFQYVGNGKIFIAGLNPDFFNKEKKLLIELLGCYWHRCPICYPEMDREDIEERIETFAKYGFKTLVVWEHEMKDEQNVVDSVGGFLNEGHYIN